LFVFQPLSRPTRGERQFYIAMVFLALMGALLACTITMRLAAQGADRIALDPFTVWTLFAGAVGALTAFFGAYSRWFGHPGLGGWGRAAIGGLIISGVGSVVGGSLILPYYGTMFAPFQLVIAMIGYPALGIAWIATLAAVHRLLIQWQAERNSIFYQQEPIV